MKEEIKIFKATVLNVIAEQKIQIYEFPDIDDDDIENNHTNNLLKVILKEPWVHYYQNICIFMKFPFLWKSKLPFAIVGSNTTVDFDGKSCRGRQYPWGVVNSKQLFLNYKVFIESFLYW